MKKLLLVLSFCICTINCYADNILVQEDRENIIEYIHSIDTLNEALCMSQFTDEDISFEQRTTTDIINQSFIPHIMLSNNFENGFTTLNNRTFIFRELNNNCGKAPLKSLIGYDTACAEITIEINNENSSDDFTADINNINDEFKALLYSDSVVLIPNSIEEKLLKSIDKLDE